MRNFTTITVLLLAALASIAVGHETNQLVDEADNFYQDLISPEYDGINSAEDLNLIALTPHGIIISSVFKKIVKQLLEQMPCGWPERGIPPLAPYRNEEIDLSANKAFLSTLTRVLRLQIDGLDNVKIKKLSVSYTFKKVKFHLIFKKIQTTSGFDTDTFLNLMDQLGISVRYEGTGNVDLSLIKLSIKGSFKYKLPLFFGSPKIYNFNAVVSLGDCHSDITGIAPTTRMNSYINDKIEDLVLSAINDNQAAISDKIEDAVVPTVNGFLKGKTVWDLIAMKPSKPAEKCVPPPNPWA